LIVRSLSTSPISRAALASWASTLVERKPLEPNVDLEAVSRRTPGFSRAQLENLMENEAAISAGCSQQQEHHRMGRD
jgi:ATP-dependent Zn protease